MDHLAKYLDYNTDNSIFKALLDWGVEQPQKQQNDAFVESVTAIPEYQLADFPTLETAQRGCFIVG